MMKSIRKVGNSYGVLLPVATLRQLGVKEGDPVFLYVKGGAIQVVPLNRKPDPDAVATSGIRIVKNFRETIVSLAER